MIRLILSDIDGTLLHGSETEIDPRYFDEIRRLRDKGILFAPSTGRQYFGIRQLFAPVADMICCLSENGNAVFSPENGGTLLSSSAFSREEAFQICADAFPDPRCQLMLSSPDWSYLVVKGDRMEKHVRRYDVRRFEVLKDYRDMPEPVCKVAVYCEQGPEVTHAMEKLLAPKYRGRYNVAVAGDRWLDFTPRNKGDGTAALCRHLGIAKDEVMAFGDNYNDAEMLAYAGQGYIMENAEEPLKERFPLHCKCVLDVLKTL